jgi:ribosomal protein S8E
MSRRHSSSRRRSYGRRQHEVRERRTTSVDRLDWDGQTRRGDWLMSDLDDDAQTRGIGDPFGSSQP